LIYGIGSILSKVVYYLLVVVLLTYLLEGKSYEFGTYGELYGYLTVLIILFSFKLDTALFRFGNDRDQLQNAFNTTGSIILVSALIIVLAGFLLTDSIAALLQYEDKPQYIRWFALILAFDVSALIPFAHLRLENKARVFALIKIFNVAFSSSLIIFFLVIYPKVPSTSFLAWVPHFNAQIDYVFLTNVISSALVLLILLFYIGKFSFRFDRSLIRKMYLYAWPLVVVGICNNFIQYNGAAVIKYLSPGSDVIDRLGQSGVFDSSRRIAGLFLLFIGAFNYAAEPFFFNNHKSEDREKLYGKICHLFVLIGGIIILGLVFGADLLQYMVGESFRESFHIIPVLLCGYLFLGIYHNVTIWYKLSDNTSWGALISIFGALITLAVSFIFIPRVGYEAFAWANLASYLFMLVLCYILGQRFYKIDYPLTRIFLSVGIIIVLLISAPLIDGHTPALIGYSIYAVLFLCYILYAFRAEKKEWLSIFTGSRS